MAMSERAPDGRLEAELYANPRMAASRAARAAMDDSEFEAFLDRQHQQNLERRVRSERARAAQGTRAKPPARCFRPPPSRTRQYARPMSMQAVRDERLSDGMRVTLLELRARGGNSGVINTTYSTLAGWRRQSRSTAKRHIAGLAAFGYVVVSIRYDSRGREIGIVILLCKDVLPFYETRRQLPTGGSPSRPDNTDRFKKEPRRSKRLWISGEHGFQEACDVVRKRKRGPR